MVITSSHKMGHYVPMSGRIDPLFKLRLPSHLRQRLESEAATARRSLTSEILNRLEVSFSDTVERLNALEKEVFDGDRGNEGLLARIKAIEAQLEARDP